MSSHGSFFRPLFYSINVLDTSRNYAILPLLAKLSTNRRVLTVADAPIEAHARKIHIYPSLNLQIPSLLNQHLTSPQESQYVLNRAHTHLGVLSYQHNLRHPPARTIRNVNNQYTFER